MVVHTNGLVGRREKAHSSSSGTVFYTMFLFSVFSFVISFCVICGRFLLPLGRKLLNRSTARLNMFVLELALEFEFELALEFESEELKSESSCFISLTLFKIGITLWRQLNTN